MCSVYQQKIWILHHLLLLCIIIYPSTHLHLQAPDSSGSSRRPSIPFFLYFKAYFLSPLKVSWSHLTSKHLTTISQQCRIYTGIYVYVLVIVVNYTFACNCDWYHMVRVYTSMHVIWYVRRCRANRHVLLFLLPGELCPRFWRERDLNTCTVRCNFGSQHHQVGAP